MRCLLTISVLLGGICAASALAEPPAPPASPDFDTQIPAALHDYTVASSWAAGPYGPGASAAVPPGASPAAKQPPADVFYINPTTFKSDTRWNADMADAQTNAWTDASVVARQASVFNGCCIVYAPRYRQASTLHTPPGVRDKALTLAYGDVERAFDYYIAHYNHGRPFILVGHSQGSWILARLLEKRIDGAPLEARMVAAYTVGINVAEGEFPLHYKHLQICTTPAQTGCVVQWNSELPSADLAMLETKYEKKFVDKYGDLPSKTTVCINPLTFDAKRPDAPASASQGAVPGDPGFGPLEPLIAGAVAAKCRNGLLIVQPSAALNMVPLSGGVMHMHDFGLFYADVRANAKLRVAAFLNAKHHA